MGRSKRNLSLDSFFTILQEVMKTDTNVYFQHSAVVIWRYESRMLKASCAEM